MNASAGMRRKSPVPVRSSAITWVIWEASSAACASSATISGMAIGRGSMTPSVISMRSGPVGACAGAAVASAASAAARPQARSARRGAVTPVRKAAGMMEAARRGRAAKAGARRVKATRRATGSAAERQAAGRGIGAASRAAVSVVVIGFASPRG